LQAEALLADRSYDAGARVIEPLLRGGKPPIIPPKSTRNVQRAYDRDNFFCRLKQFRAIATRYDKRARNFLAGVYAASILILLN
jgi:hypothetical protein